jgi:hypothetical protein
LWLLVQRRPLADAAAEVTAVAGFHACPDHNGLHGDISLRSDDDQVPLPMVPPPPSPAFTPVLMTMFFMVMSP